MTKVAVLDDWQGVAKASADWAPLQARAEVVFFAKAFENEDDAARQLADFDIVLSMRERTPLPGSLINRLPKLRMLGMTGARNASLDTAGLHRARHRGVQHHRRRQQRFGHGGTGARPADLRGARDPCRRREHPRGQIPGRRAGRLCAAGQDAGRDRAGPARSHMARYCKALSMNVIAWSQNLTAERAQAAGATLVAKDELLSRPMRSASTWCCRIARAA